MRKNIIVLLVLFSIISNAQIKIDSYNLSPKLGVLYSSSINTGIAAGLELSMVNKTNVYSLIYIGGTDTELLKSPEEKMNFLGVMYGGYKGFNKHLFRFQYQGGISAVWGVNRGKYLYSSGGIGGWFNLFSTSHYEPETFVGVGVPLKLSFKIVPLRQLSVGIDLFANINAENSSIIPMISIEIGKLRKKRLE